MLLTHICCGKLLVLISRFCIIVSLWELRRKLRGVSMMPSDSLVGATLSSCLPKSIANRSSSQNWDWRITYTTCWESTVLGESRDDDASGSEDGRGSHLDELSITGGAEKTVYC